MQTISATNDPPGPEKALEVERLLDELASSNPARQATAERALRAMGPDAAQVIEALLAPEIQSKKGRRRPLRWLPALAFVTFFAFIISIAVRLELAPLLFVPIIFAAICANMLVVHDRLSKRRRVQIAALLSLEDKQLLPLLLDLRLLAAGYPEDRKIARAIARLFTTLQPEDSALVSAEQRRQLNDSLQLAAGTDSEYFVAILEGLRQIGDHTSIPVVSRLAEADPRSAVTRAARNCLPSLNARAAQEGYILLRPSASPERAAEVLVRSSSAATTEPSELLRVAETPADRRP